jgi:hypothetical protein
MITQGHGQVVKAQGEVGAELGLLAKQTGH